MLTYRNDHFVVYMYVKSLCCMPRTYTVWYVNRISIKLGKKKQEKHCESIISTQRPSEVIYSSCHLGVNLYLLRSYTRTFTVSCLFSDLKVDCWVVVFSACSIRYKISVCFSSHVLCSPEIVARTAFH